MTTLTCPRCGTAMKPGVALVQTCRSSPYIAPHIVTISPGGPGRLVECLKCPDCGRSVTK